MSAEGGPAAPATGDTLGTGENGEIVGGPRTPQQIAAQKRVQQTQAQVDEVVGIMRVNVERVLERDQKLSELDYRADALQQGASQFEQQAGKLKRKMWWKNLKMMIIMGVIGLIVFIIIVGPYIPTGATGAAQQPPAGVVPQYANTQQIALQPAQTVGVGQPVAVQSNPPAQ